MHTLVSSPLFHPRRFATALLPFLSALPLVAQPVAPERAPEAVVELSPFTVSTDQDRGYLAADTVSGGRLSMNLLKSPNDVTALTREFIDDIGAVDLQEAAVWLTSSEVSKPDSSSDSRDFGGTVTFRGLSTGGTKRDFFPYQTSVENYITQRIEGARGPNAIIYGDAAAGGLVNVVTKRANFSNAQSVQFRVDSEGSLFGSLDFNRKLTDSFAVRLNAFTQDRKTWIESYSDKRRGAQLAATYRPWRGGEVRLDAEYTRGLRSDGQLVFRDAVSSWDGTTVFTGPRTANFPAASGTTRFTVDKLVISPSLSGITNFRLFGRTVGTNLTLPEVDENRPFASFPVLPREDFRIMPEEFDQLQRTTHVATFFEQKIGDLSLEVAAARSTIKRDVERSPDATNLVYVDIIQVLPDGSANPNFGKYYSEHSYAREITPSDVETFRIAGAYELELGSNRQIFSAVASRQDGSFSPRFYRVARTKDPTNPNISADLSNSSNAIWFWRYWDQPDAPLTLPTNAGGYEFEEYITRDTDRDDRLDTIQFNTVGYYFDSALSLVAGYRIDRYDVHSRTGLFSAGRPAGNNYQYVEADAKTASFGMTYFPWRDFGFYANYSNGFTPQSDENPWIGARGPQYTTDATNRSGGVRLRLLDGKIVGSVGYYDTVEESRMVNVIGARTRINAIWTALNKDENTIEGPFSIVKDTLDYEGTGWEADLTVNLGRGFRLRLNFALPETKQTNALPDLREYIAANEAEWEAAIADPSNPDSTTIRSNYNNLLASIVSSSDGRTLDGTYKYRANVFGNYEIQSGPFKGLRLGGGANLFGRRLIGNVNNDAFNYIYAQEYVLFSAFASYNFRFGNQPVQAALNVSNLFDYDEPVYTGTSVFANVAYRSNLYYVTPRTLQLTVTLPF